MEPYFTTDIGKLYLCSATEVLEHVDKINLGIMHAPFWGRTGGNCEPADWGTWYGSLGDEKKPEEYVKHYVDYIDMVGEKLVDNGNIVVMTANSWRDKSMTLIPEQIAILLKQRGWIIINIIARGKSFYDVVKDTSFGQSTPYTQPKRMRTTKEIMIIASKNDDYYFNKTKDVGDVWFISNRRRPKDFYFGTVPKELIEKLVSLLCPKDGIVLDPFIGSGTTAVACEELGIKWIGSEISEKYIDIAVRRITSEKPARSLKQYE